MYLKIISEDYSDFSLETLPYNLQYLELNDLRGIEDNFTWGPNLQKIVYNGDCDYCIPENTFYNKKELKDFITDLQYFYV